VRQETAALQDFSPLYDRCGSSASDRHARAADAMSASIRLRLICCIPAIRRLVPITT